jgi:hypothetical protein
MINLAFHRMALWEYYETKYKWTNKIIYSIWWPIYYQSLSKLSDEEKLCLKKFVKNRCLLSIANRNITTKHLPLVTFANADYILKTKTTSYNVKHYIDK